MDLTATQELDLHLYSSALLIWVRGEMIFQDRVLKG
jgi:hypothetical protein